MKHYNGLSGWITATLKAAEARHVWLEDQQRAQPGSMSGSSSARAVVLRDRTADHDPSVAGEPRPTLIEDVAGGGAWTSCPTDAPSRRRRPSTRRAGGRRC